MRSTPSYAFSSLFQSDLTYLRVLQSSALLPATLAYSTVKGVGWYDWGNSGLNDHEMKLNGLTKK